MLHILSGRFSLIQRFHHVHDDHARVERAFDLETTISTRIQNRPELDVKGHPRIVLEKASEKANVTSALKLFGIQWR
jgi:hypothetical protein